MVSGVGKCMRPVNMTLAVYHPVGRHMSQPFCSECTVHGPADHAAGARRTEVARNGTITRDPSQGNEPGHGMDILLKVSRSTVEMSVGSGNRRTHTRVLK